MLFVKSFYFKLKKVRTPYIRYHIEVMFLVVLVETQSKLKFLIIDAKYWQVVEIGWTHKGTWSLNWSSALVGTIKVFALCIVPLWSL